MELGDAVIAHVNVLSSFRTHGNSLWNHRASGQEETLDNSVSQKGKLSPSWVM